MQVEWGLNRENFVFHIGHRCHERKRRGWRWRKVSHTTLVWNQPWIQANHYHFRSAGAPRPWKDGEKAPLNLHWGLSDAEDLLVAQRGVFHCGFCRLKQRKRWIKSTHMLRCDHQPSECGWCVKPDLFKCSELSIHVFFPPGLISAAESEPGCVQLKS